MSVLNKIKELEIIFVLSCVFCVMLCHPRVAGLYFSQCTLYNCQSGSVKHFKRSAYIYGAVWIAILYMF